MVHLAQGLARFSPSCSGGWMDYSLPAPCQLWERGVLSQSSVLGALIFPACLISA